MFHNLFTNPDWINKKFLHCNSIEEIPDREVDAIREGLKNVQSKDPVVSVCITAFNEELNIIRCLDSLSMSKTAVPFEIVVINNNSTDRTQYMLDQIEVNSFFQPIQGHGISRQMAQEKAKGKYVLLADADCYYSPHWIDLMYKNLLRKDVVGVYSRHSYLGDRQAARWKNFLYELGKDLVVELRRIKRPYYNAYGMSFGYIRKLGLKEGFVTRNIRGEDGRMCFDLMKYGKIVLVRHKDARVWVYPTDLMEEGGLFIAFFKRVLLESLRIVIYLTKPLPHDTKTSENIEKFEDIITTGSSKKKN